MFLLDYGTRSDVGYCYSEIKSLKGYYFLYKLFEDCDVTIIFIPTNTYIVLDADWEPTKVTHKYKTWVSKRTWTEKITAGPGNVFLFSSVPC